MNFDDLKNPELQEKLRAAKTPEDILALAKEEGYELTGDQLEAINGGGFWDTCNDDWRCAANCIMVNK